MTKNWTATVTRTRPNTGTEYTNQITGIKAENVDAAIQKARKLAPGARAITMTREF